MLKKLILATWQDNCIHCNGIGCPIYYWEARRKKYLVYSTYGSQMSKKLPYRTVPHSSCHTAGILSLGKWNPAQNVVHQVPSAGSLFPPKSVSCSHKPKGKKTKRASQASTLISAFRREKHCCQICEHCNNPQRNLSQNGVCV